VLEAVLHQVLDEVDDAMQGIDVFVFHIRKMSGHGLEDECSCVVRRALHTGCRGESGTDHGIFLRGQHELFGEPGNFLVLQESGQFRAVKGCGHRQSIVGSTPHGGNGPRVLPVPGRGSSAPGARGDRARRQERPVGTSVWKNRLVEHSTAMKRLNSHPAVYLPSGAPAGLKSCESSVPIAPTPPRPHRGWTMLTKSSRKALGLAAVATSLALVATACAESDRGSAGGDDGEPFVFAAAGDIGSLDPFFVNDGESFRYSRQVFDTLLDHEPGGSEIVGGLAEDWEQSEDGTVWTFHLHDNVTFHDGDELTAEVVCDNFDRWYNLTGEYQNSNNSYYWQAIFGGFAENEDDSLPESRYVGCEAQDELTAVIEITEYSSIFPGGFSLASFGIMSPTTL